MLWHYYKIQVVDSHVVQLVHIIPKITVKYTKNKNK
jgi:hypothetical protein